MFLLTVKIKETEDRVWVSHLKLLFSFYASIPHSWLGSNSLSTGFALKLKSLRTHMTDDSNIKLEVTWKLKMLKSQETGDIPARDLSKRFQTHDCLHSVTTLITAIQIKN